MAMLTGNRSVECFSFLDVLYVGIGLHSGACLYIDREYRLSGGVGNA